MIRELEANQKPAISQNRRDFLKSAFASLALAPGITMLVQNNASARSAAHGANPNIRWAMLIETKDCGDCNICVEACSKENGWYSNNRPKTDPQWIRKVKVTDKKTGASSSLPVMCQHCSNPPCVDVCPTNASMQRADGIVLVDRHRCIGCRYCIMACPYGARVFIHENVKNQKPHMPRGKGTVESCTLCAHRIDEGKNPACVDACNQAGKNSMVFGDINDPKSDISKKAAKYLTKKIRSDLGLKPNILYSDLNI